MDWYLKNRQAELELNSLN